MDFKDKLTELKKCMQKDNYDNCIEKLIRRGVINNRYELSGLTLEEVGYVMGITRERVRQIEENAYKKLRNIIAHKEEYREKFKSLI